MQHIAIMRKYWGLTDKILTNQKKIESRWYKTKYKPWNEIKAGEVIYFKDSGEPIRLKARVKKVIQFCDLTPQKVKKILEKYGKMDGIDKDEIHQFFRRFKDKKYCLLIFLRNPQRIKPFEIDKTGSGTMAAWITVSNVSKIKK